MGRAGCGRKNAARAALTGNDTRREYLKSSLDRIHVLFAKVGV